MKASETLATYGLYAFGVDSSRASEKMILWVVRHPKGQLRGVRALHFCLDSLLQKMEAVDDGRSTGFRLDDEEAQVADILIECGAKFDVRREGSALRKA